MTQHPIEPNIGNNATPRIGAGMVDGTIYAGISPDTGKAMYTTPADASLTMDFNEVKEYAHGLNVYEAYSHDDWRAPTKAELNVLFNNRASIGGFDLTGDRITGWYWSSSSYNGISGWAQRLSDGMQAYMKNMNSSVRLVRSEAPKVI